MKKIIRGIVFIPAIGVVPIGWFFGFVKGWEVNFTIFGQGIIPAKLYY
jgi:hypothetical protein